MFLFDEINENEIQKCSNGALPAEMADRDQKQT